MDTEAYFKGRSHKLPMLGEGEELTALHFINDPNRRAPPPMLRDNAGDPNIPQQWSPPTVAYALQTATANAASQLTGAGRHTANLMGASGSSTDRLVSKGIDSAALHAEGTRHGAPGAHSQKEKEEEDPDAAAILWEPKEAPPPAAGSNPFGGGSRHQQPGSTSQQGGPGADGVDFKYFDTGEAFTPANWPKAKRPADPFGGSSRHQPPPAPPAASSASGDDFIESSTFTGPRPGYVYANRDGRIGYHKDGGPPDAAAAAPSGAPALPPALALKIALSSTSRSIEAMVKARDILDGQIAEERRNQKLLQQAVAQAEQQR